MDVKAVPAIRYAWNGLPRWATGSGEVSRRRCVKKTAGQRHEVPQVVDEGKEK